MSMKDSRSDAAALYCAIGSESTALTDEQLRTHIYATLQKLGPRDDVLLLPPDFTRFHSQAGKITRSRRRAYPHKAHVIILEFAGG